MTAPARTRALIYLGDREHLVDVLDTGRRRRLVINGVVAKGERIWTLALVHVAGESEPRWIAVERLDAAPGEAPKERGKGAIPGYSLEGSERKRAHDRERRRRQRAEARAARTGGEA